MALQLLDPTMTIQNTDGGLWLVTLQLSGSTNEGAELRVLVPKSEKSLPQIQREAMNRAQQILADMAGVQHSA